MQRNSEIAVIAGARVTDDRVDAGIGDHSWQMVESRVRRKQDKPARNSVQFDQSQGRRELMARSDENRSTVELESAAAEAGAVRKVVERYAGVTCPDMPAGRALAVVEPVTQ